MVNVIANKAMTTKTVLEILMTFSLRQPGIFLEAIRNAVPADVNICDGRFRIVAPKRRKLSFVASA